MKITTLISELLLVFICLISACSSTQTERIDAAVESEIDAKKVLIVYSSRTNNTKAVAEMIQKNVGGILAALELESPYPKTIRLPLIR